MAWGIDNDHTTLNDVLLGRPDHYRWVEAGPIVGRTLANAHKTGVRLDLQTAQAQHAEMVRIYEDAGVRCHYLAPDPVLHRNFFARDSSAMTPWGAIIWHMQLKCPAPTISVRSGSTPRLKFRSGATSPPGISREVTS